MNKPYYKYIIVCLNSSEVFECNTKEEALKEIACCIDNGNSIDDIHIYTSNLNGITQCAFKYDIKE